MADQPDESEKTEEPTQKRIEDSLKKGDVPKSQEVQTWFVLAGATLVLAMFAGGIVGRAHDDMHSYLQHIHDLPTDAAGLRALLIRFALITGAALAIPMAVVALCAIIGTLVQHPMVFSAEQMKPKLSKISLISGAKRLFSPDSLINFGKGILKILAVAAILVVILWPDRDQLDLLNDLDPLAVLPLLQLMALKLFAGTLAILTLIAGIDYVYQKQKWQKKQRMTQREVKEEYKQTEGDPQVKAKIKAIRMERARKRMMANVPEASVVITNPTHYAIALKYETGMLAPLCVAKGVDALALKIREVATSHDVPIVENPPLARALYATIDVDQVIPEEHYKAVASIIGYVMRQRNERA